MNVVIDMILLAVVGGSAVALVQDARRQRRQVRVKPRGRWL
jgi:hypothetical protein